MDAAPLLQSPDGLPGPNAMRDHPAFLRACHSPWRFIPQNVLVILRGVMLAIILAIGIMVANYKLSEESEFSNWRHLFDFAIVSFIFVFVYNLITFSWTYTHLYYPHANEYDGCESYIIRAMSLPENVASLRKQFYFTMFYTVTTVFCFMNSTIYWFVTRQVDGGQGDTRRPSPEPSPPRNGTMSWATTTHQVPKAPFSDLFGEGWFPAFVILSLYGLSSLFMVIEVFWLNSIRRPWAIGSHVLGLVFLSIAYLGWAAFGHILTGWHAFFWLDANEVGSNEAITFYCVGFVIMAPIMYTLMQGFVGIREGFTRSLSEARAIAAAHEALEHGEI